MTGPVALDMPKVESFEKPVDVKTAARFLGISPSLVYAYVERKQIPHYRTMGRAIRSGSWNWTRGANSSTRMEESTSRAGRPRNYGQVYGQKRPLNPTPIERSSLPNAR